MGDAESSYRRALAILEKRDGPDRPDVATVLLNYSGLLRQVKRKGEARRLEERARAILASRTPPPGPRAGSPHRPTWTSAAGLESCPTIHIGKIACKPMFTGTSNGSGSPSGSSG